MHRLVRTGLGAGLVALALVGTACGSNSPSKTAAAGEITTAPKAAPVTLRLGYFPNVTHASAIAGIEKGIFADKLGPNVDLKTATFNAGSAATEALFSGAIDATYIGPSPTINAWVKSKGDALRIIAGATSGGASLVVKPNINSAAEQPITRFNRGT